MNGTNERANMRVLLAAALLVARVARQPPGSEMAPEINARCALANADALMKAIEEEQK